VIAHVALFRPRKDLTGDELGSFARLFQAACRGIPSIKAARVGPVLSIHAMPTHIIGDKTYSVVVCLEFEDRSGLDAYMAHPLHTDLARLFWQYCEATVFADVEMVDAVVSDLEEVFGLKT
jgi:hypothetical protein